MKDKYSKKELKMIADMLSKGMVINQFDNDKFVVSLILVDSPSKDVFSIYDYYDENVFYGEMTKSKILDNFKQGIFQTGSPQTTPSVSQPLDWLFLKEKTKKELKQRWSIIREQERTWIQRGRPKMTEGDYFFEDNYREILKEMIARKMPKYEVGDTVKFVTYPELDADKITAIVNYEYGEFFYHLQNNELAFNEKNHGIREEGLEKTTPIVYEMNENGVFLKPKTILAITDKYGLKSAKIEVAEHNNLWYHGVECDIGDTGILFPCSIGSTEYPKKGYYNKEAATVAATLQFNRFRNNLKVKKEFWDLWVFKMALGVMLERLDIELAKLKMENGK